MIGVLWDDSHLWGYLLLNALESAGLPFCLLKAQDINQSLTGCKLLLTPGGAARQKALSLGRAGKKAVLNFVANGGFYVGFCGGAGLALSGWEGALGLCPWGRASLHVANGEKNAAEKQAEHLQHLLSGHVWLNRTRHDGSARLNGGGKAESLLAPVWWPSRFEEDTAGDVRVLARYQSAGPDFFVADIPYASLPEGTLTDWENLFGVRLVPSFFDAKPCVIEGDYGKGHYLLSYSHLETPASPAANAWLWEILGAGNLPPLPLWDPGKAETIWDAPELNWAQEKLDTLLNLGLESGLFFPRASWLLGWKTGVPGPAFNGLRLALAYARGHVPSPQKRAAWEKNKVEFTQKATLFFEGATSWLLARRLVDAVADPAFLSPKLLDGQKQSLFGAPMQSGGLVHALQMILEEFV